MTENQTVKARILAYIKAKSLSQKKFEATADLSNGYVNNLKSAPSSTIMQKIFGAFPDINEHWLMTGEGTMLKPSTVESSSMVSVETRPYIPFPVAAGELSGVGADGVMAAQMEQMAVVPFLPPYDVTTQVVGDSMRPRFLSGDIIALRDITKAGDFFQNGKVHVLDTAQGYVLKAVTLDKAHSRFICHSLNPDFPDFEVSTEDVYHVFLVVGLVRRC